MAVTKSNLTHKLALATSALLAHEAHSKQDEGSELYNKWEVDVGYLHYNEPDYISVDTYMAMINGNLSDKDSIKLGLVLDTLSGATPTGALPSSESVTFGGASGGNISASGSAGGTAPFNDTRLAMDVIWGHEWERLIRTKSGAHVSVEGDYTSVGGSLALELDSEDRSITYTIGGSSSSDKVSRTSEQTPAPLTQSNAGTMYGAGHKNSYDLLLGISRVLNRRTVGMLNFTYSQSLGYHTDPYKVLSVADENDIPLIDGATYENRPDSRERFIFYSKIKHELPKNGHHLGLSYRFHTDSWDLNSHTIEGTYGFPIFESHRLEPFARIYSQQAAKFYTKTLAYDGASTWEEASENFPNYASADIRLANMTSATLGAKFQYKTSKKGSIDLRLAYYYRDYKDAVVSNDDAIFAVIDFGKSFD
mgnify:CR=1 FL=1